MRAPGLGALVVIPAEIGGNRSGSHQTMGASPRGRPSVHEWVTTEGKLDGCSHGSYGGIFYTFLERQFAPMSLGVTHLCVHHSLWWRRDNGLTR
jgi:hypothetical protein